VTGQLNTPRIDATATLLHNGQMLAAGGSGGSSNALASAELYNPATGKFTPTGSMTTPRVGQSATLLNNGQVLVAGGSNAVAINDNGQIVATDGGRTLLLTPN
jgi:Kelch motif